MDATTQSTVKQDAPANRPWSYRLAAPASVLLAVAFAAWGLRGMYTDEILDPDATRHAMNGVMIHDWLVSGRLGHPIRFARTFYSHLPSLSIPYHPPLFPAAESLVYFAFGVHTWSARIAIALATLLSALLLYRLVRTTHTSPGFALLATSITFLIPQFQQDASDVMLEMPALVCCLGALWFLDRFAGNWDLRNALWFGCLASAAIWTKQTAIFLLATPFLVLALRRKWYALRRPPVWIAAAIITSAAGLLAALAIDSKTGNNQQWAPPQSQIPLHNLVFYSRALVTENGWIPGVVIGISFLLLLANAIRGKEPSRNHIYLAWVAAYGGVLMLLPPFDERYLFFAYPAMVVLALDVCRRALPAHRVRMAAALTALAALAVAWSRPVGYVHGPREAARLVMRSHPARILYCGDKNGDFLLSVRELDPQLSTIVIRGDQLPPTVFQPASFEHFTTEYGIDYILLEKSLEPRPWDSLVRAPTPSMEPVERVRISSSELRVDGTELSVYHGRNPSPHPKNTLQLHSNLIKKGIRVHF